MSLTPAQQQAVTARGNVLIVAGAGTGKTRTLVERCLNCLTEEKPPVSLDEILMVTFTEAAATEMRRRIRARLEEQANRHPGQFRWHEQLALFDTARIGTLHSFCLQLIREHFYELELDPQLTVLAEEETRLLAEETLDAVLQKHYAGDGEMAGAVQSLIQVQGRGWDKPIRALVLKLHHYAQTLPNPAGWFADQLALFESPEPAQWREMFIQALADWRSGSLQTLEPLAAGNPSAAACAAALKDISATTPCAGLADALERICRIREDCPRGKKTHWTKPIEPLLDDAAFLFSLARTDGPADPLAEDWSWVRSQMITLLRLAEEFRDAFTEAKRESGSLDFHDLEQYALQLLWDRSANAPTAMARQWRSNLRFIFVDEYQDINAAQDKIIEALSRDGADANRFLVGDVKQSIYRFRLANPRIFQHYAETWNRGRGQTIPLTDNFRSREALLEFVNSLFTLLMRRETGSVIYDEQANLRFGAPDERAALGSGRDGSPHVELHLRLKGGDNGEADDAIAGAGPNVSQLADADKEARLVAIRLRELKNQQHPIWDDEAKRFRAVDWADMAVLLRSPANKAEGYAKEFSRLGIPLVVARGGFYESMEVSDLLSLLQLLDNPLQDLPALAVLHSPLVGLTLDELATIRLAASKTRYWLALRRWHERETEIRRAPSELENPASDGASHAPGQDQETFRKVDAFLNAFARWRRLARQASLSHCLEAVLAETHYTDWLATQPRGEQRCANVRRLTGLAQQFDQFQRQGLFRFLRFIEAQRAAETEPEVAASGEENAVRLMSIHQSKGLEFPVVALADLAKPFNLSDLRGEVILDEQYGLCPQIQPPQTSSRYPSLPYWLARRRQKSETLGEELRLLYVAMTRARDTLILTASVSEKKFSTSWNTNGAANAAAVLSARSYADWIASWFSEHCAEAGEPRRAGETRLARWAVHDDAELREPTADETESGRPADTLPGATPEAWEELARRLAWKYPFAAATRKPAKTSVSTLRREAMEARDEDAAPLISGAFPPFKPGARRKPAIGAKAAAADIGIAHHKFLQFVSLEQAGDIEALPEEARRMEREQMLSSGEVATLDYEALAAFWQSELGCKVRAQARYVEHELAFTARFSPADLARIAGGQPDAGLDTEFIVVQGVADLAVILPKAIWLVDFKTDEVKDGDLEGKVKSYEPQLKLYALALSRIYQRPVAECQLHFLARRQTVPIKLD